MRWGGWVECERSNAGGEADGLKRREETHTVFWGTGAGGRGYEEVRVG